LLDGSIGGPDHRAIHRSARSAKPLKEDTMEYPARREPQTAPTSIKLVLIRANGALFHSLAVAALLESHAARNADRMLRFFAHDDALCAWISSEWLPARIARTRALRDYVEQTWPEFDFAAAAQAFASAPETGRTSVRPTAAHEALARSLAAAQGALFYRALSRWTEDHTLRALALRFSQEEALSLPYFRTAYEQSARVERIGFARAWSSARCLVRGMRDGLLPHVFDCLDAHWQPHGPVSPMPYREFVRRIRRVVRQNGEIGVAERILFAPWAHRPRVQSERRVNQPRPWFRPLLRSA
jgi:hypothetical protein